ncbi:hypothetical protein GALL_538280 [mine drainage metagenome]|uniref:Uncharacterized protein n=1 Tax=mine drainage metagenome TaxID=410659 RepID=A0A1J5PH67_9ZZZZ
MLDVEVTPTVNDPRCALAPDPLSHSVPAATSADPAAVRLAPLPIVSRPFALTLLDSVPMVSEPAVVSAAPVTVTVPLLIAMAPAASVAPVPRSRESAAVVPTVSNPPTS